MSEVKNMQLVRRCPECRTTHRMDVVAEKYFAFETGTLVQDAFPDLNPMEREFIAHGYCPRCQTERFGTAYTSEDLK